MVVTFKSSVCYLYDCYNKSQCYNELNHFFVGCFQEMKDRSAVPFALRGDLWMVEHDL